MCKNEKLKKKTPKKRPQHQRWEGLFTAQWAAAAAAGKTTTTVQQSLQPHKRDSQAGRREEKRGTSHPEGLAQKVLRCGRKPANGLPLPVTVIACFLAPPSSPPPPPTGAKRLEPHKADTPVVAANDGRGEGLPVCVTSSAADWLQCFGAKVCFDL